jgi:PAP2 superfamily
MPNLMLSWSQAFFVGVVLLVVAGVLAIVATADPMWTRFVRWTASFAREAAVIAFLYSAWQYAADWSINGTAGAIVRAQWINRTERRWHIVSEAHVERPLLAHAWLGQSANVYYATMHFTGLFILLLWMFLRHREQYGRVRTATAIFTGLSLLIELIPVAPPRLLGPPFVDVAAHYHLSVYQISGLSTDSLSAMPSVHVGWAAIAGVAPVLYSPSRWRWLALAYPAATVYVVVGTGNHWWFDGAGAVALLAVITAAQAMVIRTVAAHRISRTSRATQPGALDPPQPAELPIGTG